MTTGILIFLILGIVWVGPAVIVAVLAAGGGVKFSENLVGALVWWPVGMIYYLWRSLLRGD